MLPALAAGSAAVAAGILAGPAVGLGLAGIAGPRPAARPETARARLGRTRSTPDGLRAEAREAREAAERISRSEWIPAATIRSLVHVLLDQADWLDIDSTTRCGTVREERNTMTTYTCVGPVRGCCGIRHRTHEEADRCVRYDSDGEVSLGRHSDRQVVVAEEHEELLPPITYTCVGPVLGCCGIRHRTHEEADRCIESSEVVAPGDWYDRRIVIAERHGDAIAAVRQRIDLPADIDLSPVGLVLTGHEIPAMVHQQLHAAGLHPATMWCDHHMGVLLEDVRGTHVLEILREDDREGLPARLAVRAAGYHLLVLPRPHEQAGRARYYSCTRNGPLWAPPGPTMREAGRAASQEETP